MEDKERLRFITQVLFPSGDKKTDNHPKYCNIFLCAQLFWIVQHTGWNINPRFNQCQKPYIIGVKST